MVYFHGKPYFLKVQGWVQHLPGVQFFRGGGGRDALSLSLSQQYLTLSGVLVNLGRLLGLAISTGTLLDPTYDVEAVLSKNPDADLLYFTAAFKSLQQVEQRNFASVFLDTGVTGILKMVSK